MKTTTSIPKPLTHYCVSLTEEEQETILTMLDFDKFESLHNKIASLTNNPAASEMYFINVYESCEVYGGPEEGGWWYTMYDCTGSLGMWCESKKSLPFYHLYDKFVEECAAQGMKDFEIPTRLLFMEFMKDNGWYQVSTIAEWDRQINIVVEVARGPAVSHDTTKRIYQ